MNFFFPLTQHPHYRNDETSTQGVLGKAFIFRKQSYVAVSSITEPISCRLIFKAVADGRFGEEKIIKSVTKL